MTRNKATNLDQDNMQQWNTATPRHKQQKTNLDHNKMQQQKNQDNKTMQHTNRLAQC